MASAFAAQARVPEEAILIPRKMWTRDECRILMDMGILVEAQFELIHGDIIPKMTRHERHVFTCRQVQKALESLFGEDYIRMAAPIAIGKY